MIGNRHQVNLASPQARGLTYCWPLFSDGREQLTKTLGTFSAATAFQPSQIGPAAKFTGTSKLNTGIISNDIFLDTTFTVSGWYSVTNTSNSQMIMAKGSGVSGSPFGINLFSTAGKLQAYTKNIFGNNSMYRYSASSLANTGVHHFAVVLKTSQTTQALQDIQIYIDGALDQGNFTQVSATYTGGDSTQITLGDRSVNSSPLNGYLADVRIYNRGLSDAEIRALYTDPFALYSRKKNYLTLAAQIILTLADCSATPSIAALAMQSPALLTLPACDGTAAADSFALLPTALLALQSIHSQPIVDAVSLSQTLSLLLADIHATPTVSPVVIQQAIALVCLDAIAIPNTTATTLAQALLLVVEQAGSTPTAVPVSLAGQIALALAQATATATADTLELQRALTLMIEQATSVPLIDAITLMQLVVGLGKLANPRLAAATPRHGLALASPRHQIFKAE